MPQLLWDASALVKGYAPEIGSDVVRALLAAPASVPMVATYLGYAEACHSLLRKFNQGVFDATAFRKARSLIRTEVILAPTFRVVTIDDAAILAGIALSDRHNLNASDAAILIVYLRYIRAQIPGAPTCTLVAADQRLLRAAQAEGLGVLNPESFPLADVPSYLATP